MNLSNKPNELVPIIFQSEDKNVQSDLSTTPTQEVPKAKNLKEYLLKFCSCFKKLTQKTKKISLLPPEIHQNQKTLVLDLDETLVHSSIQSLEKYDLKLSIEVDGKDLDIYVLIRPGTQEFLERLAKIYEIVIFTASIKDYAEPVIDFIDKNKVVTSRLFRNDCVYYNGNYIKNLSHLGRDLKKVIIVDNSPISYSFHPFNAIAIDSWFDDKTDYKLFDVLQILEMIAPAESVPDVLKYFYTEKVEVSPKTVTLRMEKYYNERSIINSPKSFIPASFDFKLPTYNNKTLSA